MKTVTAVKLTTAVTLLVVGSSVIGAEQKPFPAIAAPVFAANTSAKAASDNKPGEQPPGAPVPETKGKDAAITETALTLTMKVPLFNAAFANTPVASVNGDYITLEELQGAIVQMHEGKPEQKTTARKNYTEVLNRLLNLKLMVQEAVNIGLDQLPEIKKMVDEFEKTTLRQLLFKEVLKDITADQKEVERTYQDLAREWKIKSLYFKKEDDAKKMQEEIKAGKNIDAQLEKLVKDGQAQGSMEAFFMSEQKVQPQVLQALTKMKKGSVSPVIPLESGFTIVMLEDVKIPENPETRRQAQQAVLKKAQQKALDDYRSALLKKYVKMNKKFLTKLDFEAPKPGFNNMLDDKRTVAEIKGEKPVTVADLAMAIKEKFFHGMDPAIKGKKVNALKSELLDQILMKRLLMKEILLKGIDKTDEYRKMSKDYKDSVNFGVFIENVIRPEVKVTEDEGKAYYREHLKEYTFPEMVKFSGLAFTSQEAAQAGVDKMGQGVDMKWLKESAEGQVKAGDPRLLEFTGKLVTTTTMSPELRKTLTGAHSGEFRLFADTTGYYYALHIQEVIPSREMPYEDAKKTIIESLYEENLKKTIEGWAKKLRDASDVTVYVVLGDMS